MAASKRIDVIRKHLNGAPSFQQTTKSKSTDSASNVECSSIRIQNVEVEEPPSGCEVYYNTIVTPEAVNFVAQLVSTFNLQVDEILSERKQRKWRLDRDGRLPDFPPQTTDVRQGDWLVSPAPRRLCCRHVDLGDVSPSNTQHFVAALNSTAQGIQTDFDDGHCPSWRNQLLGLYNVYRAVHNQIPDVPPISAAPVLMLRPRAWNMVEHNMRVDGMEVPGALFDFGLLMYHNALQLAKHESGPFFYLPKLEDRIEARLWNDIITWTEQKLGLSVGIVKTCVLIENVFAVFQLDEILYELRAHSAGLNCGIWDYSASFISKLGGRPDFVLPDRNKYVSMEKNFLSSYRDLVVATCHRRGAHATGGMAAPLLPPGGEQRRDVVADVLRLKGLEIAAGADGFMVYDLGLVVPTQQLFEKTTPGQNQLHVRRSDVKVTAADLLRMPAGGVTLAGLQHNIGVGILFVNAWLQGKGHFYFKGAVEDSATAEISRSQVWQWMRHSTRLEDGGHVTVTRKLVERLIGDFVRSRGDASSRGSGDRLATAAQVFLDIVSRREFPEFITTYLNEERVVLRQHAL